jgi:hypothetical protein
MAPIFSSFRSTFSRGLQRGEAADPQRWARAHPEGSEGLEDLRLVGNLYQALQLVRADSGPALLPAPAGDGARAPRAFLPPGTRLDQLEIERLLGHGGMGEVYLARHALMGKHFAVKVLPARLTGEDQAQSRFGGPPTVKCGGPRLWIITSDDEEMGYNEGVVRHYVVRHF